MAIDLTPFIGPIENVLPETQRARPEDFGALRAESLAAFGQMIGEGAQRIGEVIQTEYDRESQLYMVSTVLPELYKQAESATDVETFGKTVVPGIVEQFLQSDVGRRASEEERFSAQNQILQSALGLSNNIAARKRADVEARRKAETERAINTIVNQGIDSGLPLDDVLGRTRELIGGLGLSEDEAAAVTIQAEATTAESYFAGMVNRDPNAGLQALQSPQAQALLDPMTRERLRDRAADELDRRARKAEAAAERAARAASARFYAGVPGTPEHTRATEVEYKQIFAGAAELPVPDQIELARQYAEKRGAMPSMMKRQFAQWMSDPATAPQAAAVIEAMAASAPVEYDMLAAGTRNRAAEVAAAVETFGPDWQRHLDAREAVPKDDKAFNTLVRNITAGVLGDAAGSVPPEFLAEITDEIAGRAAIIMREMGVRDDEAVTRRIKADMAGTGTDPATGKWMRAPVSKAPSVGPGLGEYVPEDARDRAALAVTGHDDLTTWQAPQLSTADRLLGIVSSPTRYVAAKTSRGFLYADGGKLHHVDMFGKELSLPEGAAAQLERLTKAQADYAVAYDKLDGRLDIREHANTRRGAVGRGLDGTPVITQNHIYDLVIKGEQDGDEDLVLGYIPVPGDTAAGRAAVAANAHAELQRESETVEELDRHIERLQEWRSTQSSAGKAKSDAKAQRLQSARAHAAERVAKLRAQLGMEAK